MAVNGYLFDTNVLINFGERLYPLDIFPSLWNEIESLIENDLVLLTSGCINELQKKVGDEEHDRDNWRDWWIAKGYKINHEEHQQAYSNLVTKIITTPEYGGGTQTRALRRFLEKADPWLIAIAKSENLAIVTQESSGKLKIPTICELEGVNYSSLPEFLRSVKLSF